MCDITSPTLCFFFLMIAIFSQYHSMFDVQFSIFNIQCSMSNVQCSMFNVQYPMFNIQCSMFNVEWCDSGVTLFNVSALTAFPNLFCLKLFAFSHPILHYHRHHHHQLGQLGPDRPQAQNSAAWIPYSALCKTSNDDSQQ